MKTILLSAAVLLCASVAEAQQFFSFGPGSQTTFGFYNPYTGTGNIVGPGNSFRSIYVAPPYYAYPPVYQPIYQQNFYRPYQTFYMPRYGYGF